MGIIHSTIPFKDGGLKGIQACQRDWTKYLVHFTCSKSMKKAFSKFPCEECYSPKALDRKLNHADKESYDILKTIHDSQVVKAASPSEENHILACVSFTECNICGLVNHSERYGRFGLVFKKDAIWKLGGRPVMYLDRKSYTFFGKEFRESTEEWKRNFFSLINLYSPPGTGRVQDYSHEREWRLFKNLELTQIKPDAIVCPTKYYDKISKLFQDTIIIPLDLLEQWGL